MANLKTGAGWLKSGGGRLKSGGGCGAEVRREEGWNPEGEG